MKYSPKRSKGASILSTFTIHLMPHIRITFIISKGTTSIVMMAPAYPSSLQHLAGGEASRIDRCEAPFPAIKNT